MSGLYTVGAPPDPVAWSALFAAIGTWCAWPWCKRWVLAHPTRVAIGLAAAAGALSLCYVHVYLRGGPRIIDATSYFLEARLLSQGAFGFEPLVPTGSFRGRFLIGPEEGSSLSVIFPPGYPLLLALGFLVGQPMWVGPVIGVLLVLVSYQLAFRLFEHRSVALTAAALSTLCMALRYHTADTMSHGWAALLFGGSLLFLCYSGSLPAAAAGLAAGWLIATRPVTGALCVALALYWLGGARRSWWFLAALAPGLAVLALHQHAATGQWFSSSQTHYYALSDAPPGCFKYGFGPRVGCVHEHGDVVANALSQGFGPVEALVTSLHRLSWHALDVANLELLWLGLPFAAAVGWRRREVRMLSFATLGIIVAYAPFYFNGSYPGGGARFFADVLPLEHALLAFGLVKLSGTRLALSLALLGFAVRGAHLHQALAERDGGAPMYSAELLDRERVDHGLVLVNTDHAFNLAFDPSQRDAHHERVFARKRGDARDQLLWEALGQPPVYSHVFVPWNPDPGPTLTWSSFSPRTPTSSLTFESEYEWPVWSIEAGSAYPRHVGHPCASNGRVLELVPASDRPLLVELELVVPTPSHYRLEVGWVRSSQARVDYTVQLGDQTQGGSVDFGKHPCQIVLVDGEPTAGNRRISIGVKTGPAHLDYIRLLPLPANEGPRKPPNP